MKHLATVAILVTLTSFGCTGKHVSKFKKGDLISIPTHNEFGDKFSNMYVIEVGKEHYLLGSHYPYNPRAYNTEMEIELTDKDSYLSTSNLESNCLQ
jgi:hypothetical protein